MNIYYTASKYANYTHIHMYVFYGLFMDRLRKANLDSEEKCAIKVDIDGNVAVWNISCVDPRVDYILGEIMNHSEYINAKNVEKAVKDVAKKMNKHFEILDLELLISEITDICFSNKKPNIKDDDRLEAPAVVFY